MDRDVGSSTYPKGADVVLHALIIGSARDPKVLSLSDEFEIALDPARKMLWVDAKEPQANSSFVTGVKSCHTLYGENGCGKTELMLRIAGTFAKAKGCSRIGILYFDPETGSLMLYKGDSLGGWRLAPEAPVLLAKGPPLAHNVFYSTSPFENRRRAFLHRSSVRDVSPPFGRDLRFDGLSLLDVYPFLRGKEEFLVTLKIAVKAKLPSVDAVIDHALPLFDERRFPTHRIRTVRLQLRTWLSELAPADAEVTALNVHMIARATEQDLGNFFANSTIDLIERISEKQEYEGTGIAFHQLCERFVNDFRSQFRYTGREIWEYLRGPGRILARKIRNEVFVTPNEAAQLVQPGERGASGIARFVADLGLLEFKLKNLSSGEAAFLMLYASLASALPGLEESRDALPVFILLDEGEMFLHPSWQREYLANVLEFIARFPSVATRTHVLISTHSLIVAADSPPNTLFDVQEGRLRNGFGLGPKAVLSDVYHVDRFAGKNTAVLIDHLVNYLKNSEESDSNTVRALADALADPELQGYVRRELERRAGAFDD
jgi:energy-coupling factor transporter ATP-binding protein EcfA2